MSEVGHEMMQKEIAESEFVITMRFHGMVYSTMVGTPFICISTHDKMVDFAKDLKWNGLVDYYGFNKKNFLNVLSSTPNKELLNDYAREAKAQWQSTTDGDVRNWYESMVKERNLGISPIK